jgi:hypothetical protein
MSDGFRVRVSAVRRYEATSSPRLQSRARL